MNNQSTPDVNQVKGVVTGESTVTLWPDSGKKFSSWRNRALGTYWELKEELDTLNLSLLGAAPPADEILKRRLQASYARLRDAYLVAAQPPPSTEKPPGRWRRFGRWVKRKWASFSSIWRGSDSDRVNLAFSDVRVAIVASTPVTAANAGALLIDVQARAALILKPTDPRLAPIAELKLPPPANTAAVPGTMGEAAVALRAANGATSENLRQVRDFRNVLIAATGVIFVGAVILCLVGIRFPESLSLCWGSPGAADTMCPSGYPSPTKGDVALVALLGLLGAAVTGAIAIRKLRGTGTPYGVPLWSILIKLPIGAITAFFGLLLLHGLEGFVLSSQQAILSWALVFGVSQEAFTRFIDLRAQSVLDSVPTSVRAAADDPATAVGQSA